VVQSGSQPVLGGEADRSIKSPGPPIYLHSSLARGRETPGRCRFYRNRGCLPNNIQRNDPVVLFHLCSVAMREETPKTMVFYKNLFVNFRFFLVLHHRRLGRILVAVKMLSARGRGQKHPAHTFLCSQLFLVNVPGSPDDH